MKKTASIFFCTLILLLLGAPLLYFVDVQEKFIFLYGAEKVPQRIELRWENFKNRIFQKNFDEIYSKKFFLRKTFFKIKNQLYAWGNSGYFHSSYGGNLFAGKNNWLFEKGYLWHYATKLKIGDEKYKHCFEELHSLSEELKKRGIDFIYVLAPDKVNMYPEMLPDFYRFYLKKQNNEPHKQYSKILDKYKIPYFDAHSFLLEKKKEFTLFPVYGTHWNSTAASLVLAEIFCQLNKYKFHRRQYSIPMPLRYAKTKSPRYCENDIGDLTNLLFPPQPSGEDPVFADVWPEQKKVIVFGDSFSHQLYMSLCDSRRFSKIHRFENYLPGKKEFDAALQDTKLFILVYTTPKLFWPLDRHGDIRHICDFIKKSPVKDMKSEQKNQYFFPVDKKIPIRNIEHCTIGFYVNHRHETKGIWAGNKCRLYLPLAPRKDSKFLFTFSGFPVGPDQNVVVRDHSGKIIKKLPLPQGGTYSFLIPSESIVADKLKLLFEFPDARKPGTADQRILSFFFHDVMLSPIK